MSDIHKEIDKINRRCWKRSMAREALDTINEAVRLSCDRIVSDDVLDLMILCQYELAVVVKRNEKLNAIDDKKRDELLKSLAEGEPPF